MTIEQAEAILQAERELQNIGGGGGPDYIKGTPWYGLVKEATALWDAKPLSLDQFNLPLVEVIRSES